MRPSYFFLNAFLMMMPSATRNTAKPIRKISTSVLFTHITLVFAQHYWLVRVRESDHAGVGG